MRNLIMFFFSGKSSSHVERPATVDGDRGSLQRDGRHRHHDLCLITDQHPLKNMTALKLPLPGRFEKKNPEIHRNENLRICTSKNQIKTWEKRKKNDENLSPSYQYFYLWKEKLWFVSYLILISSLKMWLYELNRCHRSNWNFPSLKILTSFLQPPRVPYMISATFLH